ncbi:MAG: hypothetical protein COV36_04400 [Alphaproteobacteria bacterium CG11_big_fil_rev_8_21_14_0_20_44_7]|nr:MAG: hypothetical protein COV36_04400 [Alphaproteobacteria bacterium CG11_big_fil_rev_8_21_14_0_20_44_7]
MLSAIVKAFASLGTPGIFRIIVLGFLSSIALLVIFYMGVSYVLDAIRFFDVEWAEELIDFIIRFGAIMLTWFLFPVIMVLIVSLFEEKTAKIVETHEYDIEANAEGLPLVDELKLILRNLFLNILALPLYFIPVVNIVAYYWLNAYLTGHIIFRMVGSRYYGVENTKKIARLNSFEITGGGLFIVLLSNIPIINLLAPVLAILVMVHFAKNKYLRKP